MSIIYYLNDKMVQKKDIPKSAKLILTVHKKHYETPEYSKQQSINAHNFFAQMREMREDLEAYHG